MPLKGLLTDVVTIDLEKKFQGGEGPQENQVMEEWIWEKPW